MDLIISILIVTVVGGLIGGAAVQGWRLNHKIDHKD